MFRQLLKSPEYSNYDVLAQNGLSSAFSRPLSAGDANTANSSFSSVIEMEEKILTRSTVDVFVDSDDNRMRLLSVRFMNVLICVKYLYCKVFLI